ncbi:MAG: hypothetical protein HZA54_13340 [Planctomycetes bacterium]|nr:hypothetical protein [Planctomycetota bacterium]
MTPAHFSLHARAGTRQGGADSLLVIPAVGGLRFDLPDGELRGLVGELEEARREFDRLVGAVWASPAVFDRLQGTGRLAPDVVEGLGVVGVAARASGATEDLRRPRPYDAYGEIPIDVAGESGGDVLARLRVRLQEVEISFRTIGKAVEGMPAGSVAMVVKSLPGGGGGGSAAL